MKQQMDLGKLLRKIYVVDNKFLSPRYSSKEVYVRATDTNRTIVSALSNLVGMFGQQDIGHKPDIDFPSAADWPVGFVPVAVHTLDKPTDYVSNTCFRYCNFYGEVSALIVVGNMFA
ncbi:hypothetical protein OESDEN_24353 [Oesophagostomum dentatum]|uniref:acid phosphatase n=1 Tax=Oesophagostomum dentatum TaxID=61180 RepID=A0A0B1RSH1_OESDE|nr:hypothetical protein OESDEN_24353 [Oesophagostomum dentatum]